MTRFASKKSYLSNMVASRLGRAAVAAVALTVLASAPSFAQSLVTFSLVGIAGTQTVGVTADGGLNYHNEAAGRYQATVDGFGVNTFCVDLIHVASLNSSFTGNVSYSLTDAAGPLNGSYYNGGYASALTPSDYGTSVTSAQAAQRSSQVAWLADSFLNADAATFASGLSGSTDMSDNLTAISLSIWDISTDGGDGVNAGNMRIDSASQVRLGGLISYYEAMAQQNDAYLTNSARWVQTARSSDGSHTQDFTYNNVPEAGSLALLGLIMPVVPFGVRRMRRAK